MGGLRAPYWMVCLIGHNTPCVLFAGPTYAVDNTKQNIFSDFFSMSIILSVYALRLLLYTIDLWAVVG